MLGARRFFFCVPANSLSDHSDYDGWNLKRFFFLSYQVTRDTHLYLKDIEEREEGGTPAIVESIRAGMVFQLKQVRC